MDLTCLINILPVIRPPFFATLNRRTTAPMQRPPRGLSNDPISVQKPVGIIQIRPIILLSLLHLAALTTTSACAQPADTEDAFRFQGIDRHYVLHRPSNRAGPVPVVVALHGLGESVAELRSSWTMDAVADREGFAVLYPVALTDHWSYVAARAVALPDGSGTVDDIGFILGLVDRLTADHVIDPAHVYVAGVSNGGLMA